ncbi:MAG: Gfo/Idh/MocA family protein [Candidatus Cyclobacteriaceae bacterium M2_1C_046]
MSLSRRKFISITSAGLALSAISFPNILMGQSKRKLGIALVGLGNYSTNQLAPGLQLTEHCELRGIVTGSPDKIPVWQKKYNIPDKNVYNYENMHEVANNPDIDVIYIVLPNALHEKYSVIAANAGKHVWCEKPMALTVKECENIINACDKNKVKLSIGYRMQHEPDTQTIIRYGRENKYGKINKVESEAGFYYNRRNHWRTDKEMGGGAMYDMGVYPLNAARYSTGREPIAVTARHEYTRPELFNEVDEVTYFDLEFPDGIKADCMTTFADNVNRLRIECNEGWYKLEPFQSYSGVKGITSEGKIINQKIEDQQARQMDNDALALLNNKPVLVPGEEGLKDIRVVEAIFKSAERGERVVI